MRLRAMLDGQPEDEVVYDRFGMKWGVAETRSRWKKSWYSALVARARLNPIVEVQVSWLKPQPYGLDELKAKFLQALQQDAGPNAGRSEATRLERRITEAQSFDELVEVHRSEIELLHRCRNPRRGGRASVHSRHIRE
jgi:hypothetical protein